MDGGCLAIDAMTAGLMSAGAQVKVLTASTRKHPLILESLDPEYIEQTDLEGVDLETGLDVRDAFIALMNGASYNISRFYSHQYAMVLKKILSRQRYDVVHLESLYTTPYIETIRNHAPTALIALRSHNHEFQIWEQRWKASRNPIHRLILRHLTKVLERYEKSVMLDLDAIVAISSGEGKGYRNWGYDGPVHVAGFGIPVSKATAKPERTVPRAEKGIRLFHLGAMDWAPNREGVDWFIQNVWPHILQAHPKTEFHIAGRGLSKEDWAGTAGVMNHGEVEDADAFTREYDMLVVPLLRGAGIRVKIVEALSRGVPVATTDVGLHGLELTDESCVIKASPDAFADALIEVLAEPAQLVRLSGSGYAAAMDGFDRDKIGLELLDFYSQHVKI